MYMYRWPKARFISFLPFGVSSSPGIYQRSMDDMLRGIPGVCTYLDDLLITGKNDHDHKKTLEAVLQRLSDAGARLKRAKCVFEVPEIEYLEHLINALGLHPTEENVRAIILRNAKLLWEIYSKLVYDLGAFERAVKEEYGIYMEYASAKSL